MSTIPNEVIHNILSHCSPSTLSQFSSTSSKFKIISNSHLHISLEFNDSFTLSQELEVLGNASKKIQSIKLEGDTFTAEDLIAIVNCQTGSNVPSSSPITRSSPKKSGNDSVSTLKKLELYHVGFNTLRRRQLDSTFTSNLKSLHSLIIIAQNPFNFNTIARILTESPLITELILFNLEITKQSVNGILPFEGKLKTLGLFGITGITAKHLEWLLRTTSHAESLRNLALEFNYSPTILNSIRYSVLRVENLFFMTNRERWVENLTLHMPSILNLEVQSTEPIVAERLFKNLDYSLVSYVSHTPTSGITEVLRAGIKSTRSLRSIKIAEVGDLTALREVCDEKGIQLSNLDAEEGTSSPWLKFLRKYSDN